MSSSMNQNKARRSCFVPYCKAGYSSTKRQNKLLGLKNASLFKAPKEKTLFNKWKEVIPRSDKELTSNDVVCEVHFLDTDIEKYFETKLKNGEISRIERERPILKSSAVPCIFPNHPHYLSSFKSLRKHPKIRKLVNPEAVAQTSSNVSFEEHNRIEMVGVINRNMEIDDNETENIRGGEILENQSLFQAIISKLDELYLPTMRWTKAHLPHSNDLVFAKWNDYYEVEKQVILHSDMSVQVLFGKTVISDDRIKKTISHSEEITDMLKIVNDLIFCKGIEKTQ